MLFDLPPDVVVGAVTEPLAEPRHENVRIDPRIVVTQRRSLYGVDVFMARRNVEVRQVRQPERCGPGLDHLVSFRQLFLADVRPQALQVEEDVAVGRRHAGAIRIPRQARVFTEVAGRDGSKVRTWKESGRAEHAAGDVLGGVDAQPLTTQVYRDIPPHRCPQSVPKQTLRLGR
ncbi:hypothetical protein [Embleya sp. NBC_00896]|uniref:hypothetical protein n=1 Tax=Embleya sp. NBC_00896 TaxID=2975961 RepID=UPI002F91855F|nr:hypothetical protein OG928_34740 [Embleya sp. NBC_00896]